jgi:hypothetical protein
MEYIAYLFHRKTIIHHTPHTFCRLFVIYLTCFPREFGLDMSFLFACFPRDFGLDRGGVILFSNGMSLVHAEC